MQRLVETFADLLWHEWSRFSIDYKYKRIDESLDIRSLPFSSNTVTIIVDISCLA